MKKMSFLVSCILLFTWRLPAATPENFCKIALTTYNESWDVINKFNFAADEKSWSKIRAENEKKVASCTGEEEFLKLMNDMFDQLGQSHMVFLPPESVQYKSAIKKIAAGDITKDALPADSGILPLLAGGKICVGKVFKGSAAEEAGIKQGDEITRIDSFDFDASASAEIPWELIAHKMLSGKAGSEVTLGIRNSSGSEKECRLKLKPSGSRWIKLGAMPQFAGVFYYEILPGGIAYVYFNSFFPDEIGKFNSLLDNEFKGATGMIIDIRNNPGGMGIMAPALGGWISDKKLSFGDMKTKDVPLKLLSTPQKRAFKGPVAVLINSGSASTAEVFAAGVQDNNIGKLFGETSSGQCLISFFHKLSTGYRLQTVFGDFVRADGSRIEKKGAIPDFEVKNTRESLSSGHDLVIDAAVKYLQERANLLSSEKAKQNP